MNDNTLPELKTMNKVHTHQCSKESLPAGATLDEQVAHKNVTASEEERMRGEIEEAELVKQQQDQKEKESVNVCGCCDDKDVSNCCLVNHECNTTERFF